MNVGEALAYGLLGGTGKAAEHYVTDWRDRVKRTRDSTAEKDRQTYQTSEREAGQIHQAEENKKSRAFQSGENDKAKTFQKEQADADVGRKKQIAENQAIITNEHRDPGTQYAVAKDGKSLVPVTPGENGAIPFPVGQEIDGKFSYHTGTSGKGLLKGGKSAGGYETVKTPGQGGITLEGTIYRDPDTKEEFQYIRNPQTTLLERVPLQFSQSAPPSPEQEIKAEAFAKETVNELAKTFSTDATDFAPWGGSRKAAELYFKQNYLNGTALDTEGKLIIPGQVPTAPTAAGTAQPAPQTQTEPTPELQAAQKQSAQLYQALTPERKKMVQRFIGAMDEGRNPQQLVERMLTMGFTKDQLNRLFPGLIP